MDPKQKQQDKVMVCLYNKKFIFCLIDLMHSVKSIVSSKSSKSSSLGSANTPTMSRHVSWITFKISKIFEQTSQWLGYNSTSYW